MSNQHDQREMQTSSQENAHSLAEEQLQDVTGGAFIPTIHLPIPRPPLPPHPAPLPPFPKPTPPASPPQG
jgi:hypothetical protein